MKSFNDYTSAFLGLMLLLTAACRKAEILPSTTLNCPLEEESVYKANPKSAQFQNILDEYVHQGLPGIILLVKNEDGFFIGSAGMADIDKGIKMQPCHISKICSITKLMLGLTIMRLQEQGLLSINDPISDYLPENTLKHIENCDQPLTIRNLMNHTTGIYDVIKDQGFYLQILNNPAKHWTADNLLKYVYDKPAMFDFAPDDTAAYSNTNYLLLSMIVEQVTGKPHSQVMHEEVLDKLGMNDTYYFYHDALPENQVAQGYYDLYNNHTLVNLSNWNTGSGNGYGGVYSTVWDMYLFADALFVKKTLLEQSSLEQMLVFHKTVESRKNLGVACFRDFIDVGGASDYAWGHRGRDLSYSADLFYFPHHKAIMSMIVNYGTDGDSYLRPVFKEMRDEIAKVIIAD